MRISAALLVAAILTIGMTAVAPASGQAAAVKQPGYFYMDAAVLADNTEQCDVADTYVMKPARPINSAMAFLDTSVDRTTCVAQFRLYETPSFILPKSDLDFRLYVVCEDFVGIVGPGGVPELSVNVHLLNATGGEQGNGPLALTSLLDCFSSTNCSAPSAPLALAGTFEDVELGPGESEGLTLQVDIVSVATSTEYLGRIYVMTGPIPCGYTTLAAPEDMSYIRGQFLPSATEDLELATDLVYGKAPKLGNVTYGLHLLNNATETGYEFSVVDLPRPFQVTFSPLSGVLAPGESLNATLTVQVPKGALHGSVWPFQIRVDGDGGTNATVDVEIKVIAVEDIPVDPDDPDDTTTPPPPPPGPNPPPPPPTDDTDPPGVTSTGKKTPGFALVALLLAGALALAVRRRLD